MQLPCWSRCILTLELAHAIPRTTWSAAVAHNVIALAKGGRDAETYQADNERPDKEQKAAASHYRDTLLPGN